MRIRTHLCCLLAVMASLLGAGQANSQTQEARVVDQGALADALTSRYPLAFEGFGIGGTVLVRVFVREDGKADSTYVASSSGVQGLDNAALSVTRAAEFHPALEDGRAVGSWLTLALRFGRDDLPPAGHHPRVLDRGSLSSRLHAFYPDELRRAGIYESLVLSLGVDSEGHVAWVQEPRPSCFPSASQAAQAVARALTFEAAEVPAPGLRMSVATIFFLGDSVRVQLMGDSFPPAPPREPQPPPPPSDLPSTRPEIQNRAEVQREIGRRYPRGLRDQRIDGRVVVMVFIDERGRVQRRRIAESSAFCEFDLAALEVARMLRFSPAVARGEPTPVWVSMPITFSSR
jgi:periplasmic protein TonB